MTILNRLQKVGLAVAIAAFTYQPAIQPAMQESSQRLSQPSPTAPTIDRVVAAAPQPTLTTSSKQLAASAAFVDAAKSTSGGVQIIEENGQRYLELDNTFATESGPDVFVLLHREAVPNSYSPEDYVNLGRIQSFEGAQRYVIPAEVDLTDFRSAVIWCEDFNVTFGYAVL